MDDVESALLHFVMCAYRTDATPGSEASSQPRRGRRVRASDDRGGDTTVRGGVLSRVRADARMVA